MSREAAPRELEVEAAGLIRAALTGDEFTIDRIVTRAYETDLDWRSFANEVTYTAACLLIVASGSKAQATALVDTWLDSLVRKRMAAASLRTRERRYGSSRAGHVRRRSQLHLDVGGSLGGRGGVRFGLGFGLPADARGVLAAGVTVGLLGAEPPRRVFNAGDRVGDTHVGVVLSLGRFRAQLLRRGHAFGAGTCLGLAFGWPWLAGVGGGLALTLDGALQGVGVGLELAPPVRARG